MKAERRPFKKPTPQQILAARDKKVPDVIDHGLRILFCGINPGLYSGAVGHHFARPGNRFWKALHGSGLTPRRLEAWEEQALLDHGYGVTNLVGRATASAAELLYDELVRGRRELVSKVRRYHPRVVAVLGISAYRTAFGKTEIQTGRQSQRIGESELWVLPNPSGLNAHYQLPDLVQLFEEVGEFVRDDR